MRTFSLAVFAILVGGLLASSDRPRMREFGLRAGTLEPGPLNAITDVAGVRVGQVTLIEGHIAEALPLDKVREFLKKSTQ